MWKNIDGWNTLKPWSTRDRGEEVSLKYILERLTNVFKSNEQEELTIQSALMAYDTTRAQIKQLDALES